MTSFCMHAPPRTQKDIIGRLQITQSTATVIPNIQKIKIKMSEK